MFRNNVFLAPSLIKTCDGYMSFHDQSRFSQMNNIGNNGNIVICVFPYICSFLLYSNCIVLVSTKLNITGYKRITFQGWILWLYSKFQIAQLKYK